MYLWRVTLVFFFFKRPINRYTMEKWIISFTVRHVLYPCETVNRIRKRINEFNCIGSSIFGAMSTHTAGARTFLCLFLVRQIPDEFAIEVFINVASMPKKTFFAVFFSGCRLSPPPISFFFLTKLHLKIFFFWDHGQCTRWIILASI